MRERLQLALERGDADLERGGSRRGFAGVPTLGQRLDLRSGRLRGGAVRDSRHAELCAEAPAGLLLPRAPVEANDQAALRERVEQRLELVDRGELVQTLGALAQLARRLGSAQHQHGEHGELGPAERQRLVEQMAVLRGAAAGTAREPRPAATNEPGDGVADRVLVVVDDRLAASRLVGRQAQRVQRQRIGVGCRALLLDQRTENAQLGGVGLDHRWITTPEPTTHPVDRAPRASRHQGSKTRY